MEQSRKTRTARAIVAVALTSAGGAIWLLTLVGVVPSLPVAGAAAMVVALGLGLLRAVRVREGW